MTIITTATAATTCTTVTDRNRITLYIIKKDITYRNILKRSKNSLRLNLKINSKTTFRSK